MSQVEVDKIIPQSGTTLTIGDNGDTITIASGATLTGDLNADNLTSGTVPDARITGAYTGITNLTASGTITGSNGNFGSNVNAQGTLNLSNNGAEQLEFFTGAASGLSQIQAFNRNDSTYDSLDFISLDTRFKISGTERMRINSSGNLGIGTSSPSAKLEISASTPDIQLTDSDGTNQFATIKQDGSNLKILSRNNTGSGGIVLKRNIGGTETDAFQIQSNGDISFYNSAGSSQSLFWDASTERLGIGTTSPSAILHVDASGGGSVQISRTSQGALYLESDGTNGNIRSTSSTGSLSFQTNGNNEKARIDASGNFGIGTSSPGTKLDVVGTIGVESGNSYRFGNNGNTRIEGSNAVNVRLGFFTGGSERMRIDSSGRLLVGKTAIGDDTVGVEIRGDGLGQFTRSGNKVLMLNRKSSDGAIQEFRKDNTTVGSIGSEGGDSLFINSGDTGLRFSGGADAIIPATTAGAIRDNAIDLGMSSSRFADIYLGGGLYVGGTDTAHKLDDYEEGLHEASLTPSASGSVNLGGNENTLSYVKIGNLVNVQGQLSVNTLSSPVGYIKISMPFTPASLTENSDRSACSLLINNVNSATVGDFVGIVQNGASELRIYLGDTTYANEDSAQELRSGTSIYLNVSYRTT
jgi:hypothetical protein